MTDKEYEILMIGCYHPPKHQAYSEYSDMPEYLRRFAWWHKGKSH